MDEDTERLIHTTETELTRNVGGVWLCLGVAVFLAGFAVFFGVITNLHQKANWVPLIGTSFLALSYAYFSVMSWQAAERYRVQLAQLQADALKASAMPPPEVWPPPRATE